MDERSKLMIVFPLKHFLLEIDENEKRVIRRKFNKNHSKIFLPASFLLCCAVDVDDHHIYYS